MTKKKATPKAKDDAATVDPTNGGPQIDGANGAGLTTQKNQKLTAAAINRMFDEGRIDTSRARLNYWLNYAFWRGNQWLWSPDPSSGVIEPIGVSAKERRSQATVPKIMSSISNSIARIMKAPIQFEVPPQSADDYASHGAQLGTSLIRQRVIDQNWKVLEEQWATAAYLGGTAAIETCWDDNAHQYDSEVSTGDAYLSVLSIEDFVVEPGTKNAEEARWWIKKEIVPPQAAQARFELDWTPTIDDVTGGTFSERAVKLSTNLQVRRGTRVLTYYERPNWLRPNGAVYVIINSKIVWQTDDWPYPFTDKLNIDVGTCIVNPETWLGESPVTQVISAQRQYNMLWSKIHEVNHRTAAAKLMVDDRHAEAIKQMDDDPSTPMKLSGAAGAPDPHYMEPPQLSSHVMPELEMLDEAMQDILGVHAISQGDTPANIESGVGLSILSENDSSTAGRLTQELARVMSGGSTKTLQLLASKVKDSRTTIVNESRYLARPMKWTGKDLAGQTQVIVPADSVLPRSRAGVQQMAQTLLQMAPQWFPTFASFAQLASVPGADDMIAAMDDDIALAEWENFYMAEGNVVIPNSFDDDAKHIQQHNHFRKSPRYKTLAAKTQEIFEAHIQAHQANASHKQGQAVAMQAMHPALGGTPMGQLAGPGGQLPQPQSLPQQLQQGPPPQQPQG